MKISVVIVLYNPLDRFINNYLILKDKFHKVIFVDNSTKKNEDLIKQIKDCGFDYYDLNGNKGIACALNKGLEVALQDEIDYILTLDQDSVFPFEKMTDIENVLESKLSSDYGIVGLNFNSPEETLDIVDVKWWLTSGNFINVKNLKDSKIKFNEGLFIDGVDACFCHDFIINGYKVGYIKGISLQHTIGNPTKKRIFGKEFSLFNYSPIRYYYIFRNNYYLYKKDKKFFKQDYKNTKYIIYFKVLFFEDNKKAKLRAIKLGKKDAKKEILGPCNHSL